MCEGWYDTQAAQTVEQSHCAAAAEQALWCPEIGEISKPGAVGLHASRSQSTVESMSRSLKKGPYVDPKLYMKVDNQNESGMKQPITTWARACTIVPEFVGHTFMVHNGKNHIKVFVTEDMVGHKLGEFSPTRSFRGHGGKGKK
jgi:small subunit ribosomal protein S19